MSSSHWLKHYLFIIVVSHAYFNTLYYNRNLPHAPLRVGSGITDFPVTRLLHLTAIRPPQGIGRSGLLAAINRPAASPDQAR